MIKTLLSVVLLCGSAATGFAQLTMEQKLADFRFLAGEYAKYYAPYEWKRALFGFDALDIGSWLKRVGETKDDLDFYEICVEYVASLNDSHAAYSLPSRFLASLGFTVDIYDGKVLIDGITRSRLPADKYPFVAGDELVSVDGRNVEDLIGEFRKYAPAGNPRSSRRNATTRIVSRPQSRMPHAVELGESAAVVILRQNGEMETYSIPWIKTGLPIEVGPVPTPKAVFTGGRAAAGDQAPEYMKPLVELQYSGVSEPYGVLNYGSRTPLFALPAGFVQRLGRAPADFFYSGAFDAGGYKIGYIRIPNYGSLATSVLQQFETEIAYFEQNTDGLIVDEMRNTGGYLCFGENIVARLTPYQFRATGYLLRAFRQRVNSFYSSLNQARAQGAEQWVIDLWEVLFDQVYTAYRENRGLTGPLPLCSPSLDRQPATDRNGKIIAYTKPLMVLVDEFSTSTADSVPAMIQDAGRGLLFGWRTNGAGGTNTSHSAGAFSEGAAGLTLGLMTRKDPVVTPDYPAAPLIENIGVRPEIEADYMTRDNLLRSGRPFVDAFTAAMVEHIKKSRK
jgi:C-terminal processing protease CtpA/Prc